MFAVPGCMLDSHLQHSILHHEPCCVFVLQVVYRSCDLGFVSICEAGAGHSYVVCATVSPANNNNCILLANDRAPAQNDNWMHIWQSTQKREAIKTPLHQQLILTAAYHAGCSHRYLFNFNLWMHARTPGQNDEVKTRGDSISSCLKQSMQ